MKVSTVMADCLWARRDATTPLVPHDALLQVEESITSVGERSRNRYPCPRKGRRIWYETLLEAQLRPRANFQRFASLTLGHADKPFGPGSIERQHVQSGLE